MWAEEDGKKGVAPQRLTQNSIEISVLNTNF